MTTTVNLLRTTFVPPAECTTDTYYVSWSHSSGYTWRWESLGAQDWSTCFPSNYVPTSYYSPGVCPEGYSAAGQSLVTDGNDVETRATCCPSYYNAQTGDDWPWYSTNPCTSSNDDVSSVYSYTVTDSGTGTTTITQTGTFGINAKGISIRWRASDFASTITSPSASTATRTSTTTSATSTTNLAATSTAINNGRVQHSHKKLSTGAKAGIGIGVAAGAILLIALAFLCYRRRRKTDFIGAGARLNSRISMHEIGSSSDPAAEMDTTQPRTWAELDTTR